MISFGHEPPEAQPGRPDDDDAAPIDAEQESARERQRECEREASRPFH